MSEREDRCEANVYFEDKKRGMEISISCEACPDLLIDTILSTGRTESRRRFKAKNDAERALGQKCGKWQEKVLAGDARGEMPDYLLPRRIRNQ